MFTDKVQTEHDVVLQLKDSMEVASYGLLDTLRQLAGETGEVEEIELKEVKTERRMEIKRRKKKRPKSLMLEDGNGGKIYKNIQTANSIQEDTISPTPCISDPDWKPISQI